MLILSVVGARPNFMKMAPIILELKNLNMHNMLIHTGQHYDWNMSEVFFKDLSIKKPDIFLNVGSSSHSVQTADVMVKFEKICVKHKPKLIIVAGDVNSTLACALVAAKMCIPLAHVESGLRSFDNKMPEEINRILTDRISDLLFVTEKSGIDNLITEGFSREKIHFVGNSMIDSLVTHLDKAIQLKPWQKFDLEINTYCLITMHRPSNVDNDEALKNIISMLNNLSKKIPVIFPVHPRTRNNLKKLSLEVNNNVIIADPMSYLVFIGLLAKARIVITDSGGIQEETTFLGIQCITFRENTERPVTINEGTNHLVGVNVDSVLKKINDVLNGETKKGNVPEKWDGNSSKRISNIIARFLK
tara:strand:- start:1683 stop:2762 length:1080 start_codon:yes stop_codon:yes gene_type:complete